MTKKTQQQATQKKKKKQGTMSIKLTLSPQKIILIGCVYVWLVVLLAIHTTKISDDLLVVADDDVTMGLLEYKNQAISSSSSSTPWKRNKENDEKEEDGSNYEPGFTTALDGGDNKTTTIVEEDQLPKVTTKVQVAESKLEKVKNGLRGFKEEEQPKVEVTTKGQVPSKPQKERVKNIEIEEQSIRGFKEETKQQKVTPKADSKQETVKKLDSDKDIRGFGLCLLIKDDNDILPEWIAYHYHALEMRQLVVSVDPSSTTRPEPVLQRFQKELPDLNVEVWNDEDYMPDWFLDGNYSRIPNFIGNANATHSEWHSTTTDHFQNESSAEWWLTSINNHRFRQTHFVGECVRYLHRKTITKPKPEEGAVRWMAHIDTDEFLVLNPELLTKDKERYEQVKLNDTLSTTTRLGMDREDLSRPWKTMQESSVLDFMDQWFIQYPINVSLACIQIPRLLFGDYEKEKEITAEPNSPFDSSRFETLRWKWHAPMGGIVNGHVKVLMDLTKLKPKDRILAPHRRAVSVHRISNDLCPNPAQQRPKEMYATRPIISNHYLGSSQRYLSKGDPRRSIVNHQKKSNSSSVFINRMSVDWLNQWLPKMIEILGEEKVKRLLPEYLVGDANVELVAKTA